MEFWCGFLGGWILANVCNEFLEFCLERQKDHERETDKARKLARKADQKADG